MFWISHCQPKRWKCKTLERPMCSIRHSQVLHVHLSGCEIQNILSTLFFLTYSISPLFINFGVRFWDVWCIFTTQTFYLSLPNGIFDSDVNLTILWEPFRDAQEPYSSRVWFEWNFNCVARGQSYVFMVTYYHHEWNGTGVTCICHVSLWLLYVRDSFNSLIHTAVYMSTFSDQHV